MVVNSSTVGSGQTGEIAPVEGAEQVPAAEVGLEDVAAAHDHEATKSARPNMVAEASVGGLAMQVQVEATARMELTSQAEAEVADLLLEADDHSQAGHLGTARDSLVAAQAIAEDAELPGVGETIASQLAAIDGQLDAEQASSIANQASQGVDFLQSEAAALKESGRPLAARTKLQEAGTAAQAAKEYFEANPTPSSASTVRKLDQQLTKVDGQLQNLDRTLKARRANGGLGRPVRRVEVDKALDQIRANRVVLQKGVREKGFQPDKLSDITANLNFNEYVAVREAVEQDPLLRPLLNHKTGEHYTTEFDRVSIRSQKSLLAMEKAEPLFDELGVDPYNAESINRLDPPKVLSDLVTKHGVDHEALVHHLKSLGGVEDRLIGGVEIGADPRWQEREASSKTKLMARSLGHFAGRTDDSKLRGKMKSLATRLDRAARDGLVDPEALQGYQKEFRALDAASHQAFNKSMDRLEARVDAAIVFKDIAKSAAGTTAGLALGPGAEAAMTGFLDGLDTYMTATVVDNKSTKDAALMAVEDAAVGAVNSALGSAAGATSNLRKKALLQVAGMGLRAVHGATKDARKTGAPFLDSFGSHLTEQALNQVVSSAVGAMMENTDIKFSDRTIAITGHVSADQKLALLEKYPDGLVPLQDIFPPEEFAQMTANMAVDKAIE